MLTKKENQKNFIEFYTKISKHPNSKFNSQFVKQTKFICITFTHPLPFFKIE